MVASVSDSEVDMQLLEQPRGFKSWKKAAIAVSTSLLLGGAIGRWSNTATLTTSTVVAEEKFQVLAPPGRQFCSNTKDNCFSKGCCNVEGFNCFETSGKGNALCMKTCDPKKYLCSQPTGITNHVLDEAIKVKSQALYCFAVVTVDTGSPTPSNELDLMNYQAEKNLGIFQCEDNQIFSDGDISLSNGRKFYQVFDQDGDWKFAKREETGAWVNTGLFSQVWREIQKEGTWERNAWVVKVDPDAVFVVDRLRTRLESTYEIPSGAYFTNCPYVDYGFFGNLEVFSKIAWTKLLANIDQCKADTEVINWQVGIKKGKYGPMGEDLFAQTCLDKEGVKHIPAFDMTVDGACESKRDKGQEKNKKWQPHCDWQYGVTFHPFKDVAGWAKCHEQTMAAFPKPK